VDAIRHLKWRPGRVVALQESPWEPISLKSFDVPVLLLDGEYEDEEDVAGRTATTLPNGERLRLPGLGHCWAFARSDLVLPTARNFLDRWFAWSP
jgi:hypothetical protein